VIEAGADLDAVSRIRNAVAREALGSELFDRLPGEVLAELSDPFAPHTVLLAEVDERIVGYVDVERYPDGSATWIGAEVEPSYRGRGIASALFDRGLALIEPGAVVQSWSTDALPGAGEALTAATGFGAIAASSPSARFLIPRGFRLEQHDRLSLLDLPFHVDVHSPPDGYRVVQWLDATPDERLEQVALAMTRMNLDPPSGGLAIDTLEWTAERVSDFDLRTLATGGHFAITVIEHVASGDIAGFTRLFVHPSPVPASQWETLVFEAHRGQRLGMLLKLANLRQLQDAFPGLPGVVTGNAEENRHMLDVNEALGFRAVGFESLWKLIS
jgi:GNAT superfamily N-acetyltransferase